MLPFHNILIIETKTTAKQENAPLPHELKAQYYWLNITTKNKGLINFDFFRNFFLSVPHVQCNSEIIQHTYKLVWNIPNT